MGSILERAIERCVNSHLRSRCCHSGGPRASDADRNVLLFNIVPLMHTQRNVNSVQPNQRERVLDSIAGRLRDRNLVGPDGSDRQSHYAGMSDSEML